jgi:hypothetical protein
MGRWAQAAHQEVSGVQAAGEARALMWWRVRLRCTGRGKCPESFLIAKQHGPFDVSVKRILNFEVFMVDWFGRAWK